MGWLGAGKMVQKGADLPEIRMGVDIQPTPSRGTQRQKIGRGTRPDKDKESFVYLDMVGNHKDIFHLNKKYKDLPNRVPASNFQLNYSIKILHQYVFVHVHL